MSDAETIAKCLGNARREGPGRWVCSCPVPGHGKGKGDRTPSLSLMDGPDGLVVHCFSGCQPRDVYDTLRRRGMIESRSVDRNRSRPIRELRQVEQAPSQKSDLARKLWRETIDPRGTIGQHYLEVERGLVGCINDVIAGTVRFHPAAPFRSDTGRTERSPALVCAVRSLRGVMGAAGALGQLETVENDILHNAEHVQAVQRIRLTSDGKKIERKSLGPLGDDGIVLIGSVWEIFYSSSIVIAEGVETALAMRALGAEGCAAIIGLSRLRTFYLPPHVGAVLLSAENDDVSMGECERFAQRWIEKDREVSIWLPDFGKDANDRIRGAA